MSDQGAKDSECSPTAHYSARDDWLVAPPDSCVPAPPVGARPALNGLQLVLFPAESPSTAAVVWLRNQSDTFLHEEVFGDADCDRIRVMAKTAEGWEQVDDDPPSRCEPRHSDVDIPTGAALRYEVPLPRGDVPGLLRIEWRRERRLGAKEVVRSRVFPGFWSKEDVARRRLNPAWFPTDFSWADSWASVANDQRFWPLLTSEGETRRRMIELLDAGHADSFGPPGSVPAWREALLNSDHPLHDEVLSRIVVPKIGLRARLYYWLQGSWGLDWELSARLAELLNSASLE